MRKAVSSAAENTWRFLRGVRRLGSGMGLASSEAMTVIAGLVELGVLAAVDVVGCNVAADAPQRWFYSPETEWSRVASALQAKGLRPQKDCDAAILNSLRDGWLEALAQRLAGRAPDEAMLLRCAKGWRL
jgi:hypothetical protein